MAATRLAAVHITPACRLNRGDVGAWNEAIHRLRVEYLTVCAGAKNASEQPTMNVVLTLDRPRS